MVYTYGPCVAHAKNKLSSKITKNVYPRSYCYYSFFCLLTNQILAAELAYFAKKNFDVR